MLTKQDYIYLFENPLCVTVDKPPEMTNVAKLKTGSSSSGTSDSSDSEDSDNGTKIKKANILVFYIKY